MTKEQKNKEEEESGKKEEPQEHVPQTNFGRFFDFVYEFTFIVVVLTLGTLCGVVVGVLMPVLIPGTLIWQRYVSPWNKMRNVRRIMDEHKRKIAEGAKG